MAAMFDQPKPLVTGTNPSDAWIRWKKRFENYIEASGFEAKPEKQKIAILLHVVGEEAQEVASTFTYKKTDGSLIEAKDLKMSDVLGAFESHYIPRRNVTFERRKFRLCVQKESQTVDEYLTELRRLVSTCEYSDLASEMVKDQLVGGIISETLKERLLRTRELDLDKALDICRAAETSKEQLKSFMVSEASIQAIRKRQPEATSVSKFEKPQRISCTYCGKQHQRGSCPAYGKLCKKCHRKNHFAVVCRSQSRVNNVETEVSDSDLFLGSLSIGANGNSKTRAVVRVGDQVVNFKLDSGADANMIPFSVVKRIQPPIKVQPTRVKISTYTKESIALVGSAVIPVTFEGSKHDLKFLVTMKDFDCILGENACFERLKLLQRVNSINKRTAMDIIEDYHDVFEGPGKLSGEYHIRLKEGCTPKVSPARRIPFAIMEKVKAELDRMESIGTVAKVTTPTDWVHPMVVIKKTNGKLRICLDPQELNEAMYRSHFKMPTFEEITAKLAGAKIFTVLDAKTAFHQKVLDEESSFLCTFATPFGRYRFTRLPYGIKSAPEVFQQHMSQLFDRCEQTIPFVDDILIWGKSEEDHNRHLESTLRIAINAGLKLEKTKMQLAKDKVKYLGHVLSAEGVSIDKERIDAIQHMPKPVDKAGLQRWLGMVTFLSRFLENNADDIVPLRKLLSKDVEWQWNESYDQIYEAVVSKISKAPALSYFDPKKDVQLEVDASSTGMGAVLIQDGKPVAFASTTLTPAQSRYAHIEKELSALVFGCERFHQFLYGIHFQAITDHKPLIAMIKKPLSELSSRMQRLFLRIQRYDMDLVYKPGKQLVVADTLSRSPLKETKFDSKEEDFQVMQVLQVYFEKDLKLEELKSATKADPVLASLKQFVEDGWPKKERLSTDLKRYWSFKSELQVYQDLLLKGDRIIIPSSLRKPYLINLHAAHQGIVNTLARARSAIYWPGMTTEIHSMVEKCETCARNARLNPKEALMQHPFEEKPWVKVAADFFDFKGNKYLEVIDYYSKFIEVMRLDDLCASSVIPAMKSIFARHGIPKCLVSDGGPPFNSYKFAEFADQWKFNKVTTSAMYAQSNGMVERSIQTVKRTFRKVLEDSKDPYMALLILRTTPLQSNGNTPAKLLMGRVLNSNLPYIDLHNNGTILNDIPNKLSALKPGDRVWSRNRKKEWERAVVEKSRCEPRSYKLRDEKGEDIVRNRVYIRPDKTEESKDPFHGINLDTFMDVESESTKTPLSVPETGEVPSKKIMPASTFIGKPNQAQRSRYGREIRKPQRFADYV